MINIIEEETKLKNLFEIKNVKIKTKKYGNNLKKILYCFAFIFILTIIGIIIFSSINYYNADIFTFNQDINNKYIKSQNYFCDNQKLFNNKKFEDKIRLIDIKFNDLKFNMYVYNNSDTVSGTMIANKAWEVSHTNKLLKALNYYENKKNIKTKDIYIIDIGANVGWYSFIFGKYGYNIISFEPSMLNMYILKKNFCLNKEINITLINKGLFNEEKVCYLYSHINNQGDGFVKCNENQTLSDFYKKEGEIILTQLSNYLSFFKNKNLALIKMDVEGAEGKAFDGGIEFITKYHIPFIFFEFDPRFLKRLGTDLKKFLQLFADNGYKISIKDFFNDYISVDDVINKNTQLNLYIVYSKILE